MRDPPTTGRKLLVAGASGLIGTEIVRAAARWTVLGVARSVAGAASESVDLEDHASIRRVLSDFCPDVVVVAAAWPWVDGCERDPLRSRRQNVDTVGNLLSIVPPATRIVFFSTDHVFDGTGAVYSEDSPTNPPSVYAKHKRQVETLLLERGASLVVRTSYVFGVEERRRNFMYRVVEAAERGDVLKVPVDQAGMPTWSTWLAESTLSLLENGVEGVIHLTGPEVLTKANWARRVAEGLGLHGLEVKEVPWEESGQVAPRPARVHLVSNRHTLRHPPLIRVLRDQRARVLSPVTETGVSA